MKLLSTFLLIIISSITHAQQPGTLDKSYANEGSFLSGNINYNITAADVQKDNKVVIGGANKLASPNNPYIIIRHNSNGLIDSSFGNAGIVTTSFTGYNFGTGWSSIKVQADGKIIAAGFDYKPHQYDGGEGPNLEGDIVMTRLKPDGSYDSSFGNNGIVITDLGKHEEVHAMALQPDGKIVLAGISDDEINYSPKMLTVRYNVDGSLDKSFSNGGYAVYDDINYIDAAYAVTLQQDGKIVLGGYYNPHEGFMLLRYLPDGTVDNDFGNNGVVKTQFNEAGDQLSVHSIIMDDAQNIFAGGTANGNRMVIVKYNYNGYVDNTFNKSGITTVYFNNLQSNLTTLFLQADGRLLLTGDAGGNAFYGGDIALTRLLPDGALDSSFGTNGQTVTDLGNIERTYHAVMQSDGKVVLAGTSYSPGQYSGYFLARYNVGDGRQSPIVRIRHWLQHHGISWQAVQSSNTVRYYSIQRSYDGIVYKDVAKVSPKVNTYEEAAPLTTANSYYRIAATSWDGTRTYSNTMLVDDGQAARIFPNPVSTTLQVQNLPLTGKTNLSIVDLNGNVRSSATATGSNYSVNTAALGSGSYLLKIQHNGTATTLPFVKE